jgi:hypothetical protein
MPLSKDDRLNAKMFNFGAKLIDLCQNHMLIKSLHPAFPQICRVDASENLDSTKLIDNSSGLRIDPTNRS